MPPLPVDRGEVWLADLGMAANWVGTGYGFRLNLQQEMNHDHNSPRDP